MGQEFNIKRGLASGLVTQTKHENDGRMQYNKYNILTLSPDGSYVTLMMHD